MVLSTLWIVLRALHFIAVLLLAGSAFYTALLAPRRYRPVLAQRLHKILVTTALLSLLSAVLMLATQTGLMSGDWHNVGDLETWQAVLATRFGAVWCWELGFALLSTLALLLRGTLRQQLLLISGLLQLAALAGVGHAAMRDGLPGLLQQINHALHLIAAAFWTGGLLPLLLLMREARQITYRTDAIRCMMRFSRYWASGCRTGFAHRADQQPADWRHTAQLGHHAVECDAGGQSDAGDDDGGHCADQSLCSGARFSRRG
jgi:Putative copper export protein